MSKNAPREIALLGKLTPKPRRLDSLAKHILLKRLAHLQHGSIKIIENDQSFTLGSVNQETALANIHVTLHAVSYTHLTLPTKRIV